MAQISCSNSRRPPGGASTRRAGSPDACSSKSRTVTASRSAPRHSAKHAATGSSRRKAPVRTNAITTVVVAITLVNDARSNGVSRPVPRASDQSGPALDPTSTVAAGKTPTVLAVSTAARASSIKVAGYPCDRRANGRADQDVPRPRNRREHPDANHRQQRRADADDDVTLPNARRQHAEQERAEHRAVDDRGDRQTDGEDGSPAARQDRDDDQHDPPRRGQPARELQQLGLAGAGADVRLVEVENRGRRQRVERSAEIG